MTSVVLNIPIFLLLKEPIVANVSETWALTSRKCAAEQGEHPTEHPICQKFRLLLI